jgi:erythrocyte band 7 integral membrane protein
MVSIDACVYYRVINSRRVVYSINNIREAVSELTFATLRSVIGHYTLQELLEKRGDIIKEIEIFVESHV